MISLLGGGGLRFHYIPTAFITLPIAKANSVNYFGGRYFLNTQIGRKCNMEGFVSRGIITFFPLCNNAYIYLRTKLWLFGTTCSLTPLTSGNGVFGPPDIKFTKQLGS